MNYFLFGKLKISSTFLRLSKEAIMFHKIKNVYPLTEYRLSVQFAEGCTKIYDMKPLFEQIPLFAELKESHSPEIPITAL